ncbi:MAG: dihydrodipicolinate synthase family protein [Clostridia bacterium]|nr:dihydrodipicolinate synthase family protein [Clostridia bacterium]
MIRSIPGGVYPTMVTPFTPDNRIDFNAVEQMLHWYDGKVDGVFAVCQSSEMFFLSFEERLSLMRFIREHAPKGMAVVASGHTAPSIDRQIEEAKAFIDTGVDSYVFISNRFAGEDEGDDVFLENVDYVVNRIPQIALGIYECPVPYRRLLSPETLGVLAKGGRFTFLKDTCCDADVIRAKLRAVEGTPLKIFNANSASLLPTLRDGAAGFSGVMANFHPELYFWLCHSFDKEPEKAELVQSFLGFASLSERQIYPPNAKYYLSLEGLDITTVTRSKNYNMSKSEMLEMQQLRALTADFKAKHAL